MKEKNGIVEFTNKIHDTLELLRLRHSLFLSSKSITALEDYINGYMVFGKWGFYDFNLIYDEGDVDLNEFKYWVQKKPIVQLSPGPNFSQFLLQHCKQDEEVAFDLFFTLLDEFKKIKNQ